MTVDVILTFVGKIVAYGGSAAGVAYVLFRTLAKSWLDNRFAEKLESLRHSQALELQRLRVEIDALLSGAVKLQEREFDVLPEAWAKLDEAHSLVAGLVSPMQQYADVDRMTPRQLDELLADSGFTETQKDDVRNSTTRSDTYRDILFWQRLSRVRRACWELQQFVARNGIFLPADLKADFSTISEELGSALVAKEVGHQVKDWKMQTEGWDKVKKGTEPLYKKIEERIQARLASHGRMPKALD